METSIVIFIDYQIHMHRREHAIDMNDIGIE